VADVLLRPHRSYLAAVLPLIGSGAVSALAHITGGGIPENLVRVLPDGVQAHIDLASWRVPVEFRAVQQRGRIKEQEMFLTFNMGVGMILIVPPDRVDGTLRHLADHGERAWVIGVVLNGTREVTIR
jgi:phosphoribosylformylglycinamidine cyclo-ligase